MPSPLAHCSIAYVWYRLFRRRLSSTAPGGNRGMLPLLLVAMALSLLPDVDSAAGILLGDVGRYHNQVTHSLLSGLGVALAAGAVAWVRRPAAAHRWFLFTLLCYETHVVMDYLTVGRGVLALWPCSPDRYGSPVSLFYGLHWSDGWWTSRHLWTLLSESAFAGLVVFAFHHRTLRNRQRG